MKAVTETTAAAHRLTEHWPINISEYFNNDGVSYDGLKCDGSFDGNGCTYPAEELPPSNTIFHLDGIPFLFPSKENGEKNNMVVRRQVFPLPGKRARALYVIGACEGPEGYVHEEEALLTLQDGRSCTVYIGLSNWVLHPVFGESVAFECSHLHFPDPGQAINRNIFALSPPVDYRSPEPSLELSSRLYLFGAVPERDGNWRPRLWLKRVAIPADAPVKELAFVDENLNFHIMAMTLEFL